jgi:hypothetical protein
MSPPERFPPRLEAFVSAYVRSVLALETLLLLRRTMPDGWSAAALSLELRIDPNFAGAQLDELAGAGLLERSGEPPRYGLVAERDAIIAELELAYAQRRVSLIGLIYAAPDPARDFAEAFRLRKESEDG